MLQVNCLTAIVNGLRKVFYKVRMPRIKGECQRVRLRLSLFDRIILGTIG